MGFLYVTNIILLYCTRDYNIYEYSFIVLYFYYINLFGRIRITYMKTISEIGN